MILADLRALCERATKGPWRSVRNSQRPYKHVIFDGKPDHDAMYTTSPLEAKDADFIAAASTWLPALVDLAELLRQGVPSIRRDTHGWWVCEWCGATTTEMMIDVPEAERKLGGPVAYLKPGVDPFPHNDGCRIPLLAHALARLDEMERT